MQALDFYCIKINQIITIVWVRSRLDNWLFLIYKDSNIHALIGCVVRWRIDRLGWSLCGEIDDADKIKPPISLHHKEWELGCRQSWLLHRQKPLTTKRSPCVWVFIINSSKPASCTHKARIASFVLPTANLKDLPNLRAKIPCKMMVFMAEFSPIKKPPTMNHKRLKMFYFWTTKKPNNSYNF